MTKRTLPKTVNAISFRVAFEEETFLNHKSALAGISRSDYIRRLVLADMEKAEGEFNLLAQALGRNVNTENRVHGVHGEEE